MEIRSILSLARKWLLLLILASLLGAAAGLVFDHFRPKVYEADVTLFVSSANHSDYSSLLGDQQAASAFVSFPRSDTVLKATLEVVGDKSLSLAQLASMVTVANYLNSQFVSIGVRDTDPERATLLAREIAKQSIAQFQIAVIDKGNIQFLQNLQGELDRLTSEIKSQEQELSNARSHPIADPVNQTARINELITNLSALRQEYSQLFTSYASISTLQNGIQVTILDDAQVPQQPIGTGPKLASAIGALAGLLVIVGVIVFIEQTDDTLRTPAKVNKATGLTTLIIVKYLPLIAKAKPALSLNDHREFIEVADSRETLPERTSSNLQLDSYHELTNDTTQRLPVIKQQTPAALDDLNDLKAPTAAKQNSKASARRNSAPVAVAGFKVQKPVLNGFHVLEEFLTLGPLLHSVHNQTASNDSNIRSLLITSPESGDGKTFTALQCALGLARTGVKVVLIDANLHKPQVHDFFGLSNRIGLSSILTASYIEVGQLADFTSVSLQEIDEPNLTILSGGPPIDSSAELLSSSKMTAIIKQLSETAFVVIDAPAVLTSSQPALLASKSNGILIVVNARHTTATKLNRTMEILTQINKNILGVVLNRANSSQ